MPSLTTRLRGGAIVTVELRTLDHAAHSGLFGGPVPDALTTLCRLLARCTTSAATWPSPACTRGTADPVDLTEAQLRANAGLLDGVRFIGTGGLTDRLWAAPAIAVVGLDPPPRDGLQHADSGRPGQVSLRVAPGDDADRACDALDAHLQAHAPWGARVTVTSGPRPRPTPSGPAARRPGRARGPGGSLRGPPWKSGPAAPSRS